MIKGGIGVRLFLDRLFKFVRTKLFIVLASVALFLTVFSLTLSLMGRTDIIKAGVNLVTSPFRAAFAYCARGIDGFASYFTELDRLREENEALRGELGDAISKLEDAEAALEENKWLREFLLYKEEYSEYGFVDARVTARDSSGFMTTFTVNRGSSSGLSLHQPVITADGLVGYVSELGRNYAKISTLLNGDVTVGALSERSGAYGMLEGGLSSENEGLCRLVCANGQSDIKEGDVIVTSGVGKIYPYGLKIGNVVSVETDEFNRTLIAYIEPSADIDALTRVMVLIPSEGGESDGE